MLFSEKLDLRLIRLVRDNKVLYDNNDAKYMDFNAREVAWQRIGDELKRPGELGHLQCTICGTRGNLAPTKVTLERLSKYLAIDLNAADCKVRWINIRDVYRRILRKSLRGHDPRTKVYKYESELSFMRSFYKEGLIQNGDFDSDGKIFDTGDFEHYDGPNSEEDKPKKQVKIKSCKASKKKKRKNYEEEKHPQSVPINEVSEFDASDPVDAFLLSIGATLKTFTPYHLNQAKSKIFAVVQEYDLQQIMRKGRTEESPHDTSIVSTYLP